MFPLRLMSRMTDNHQVEVLKPEKAFLYNESKEQRV
jgi:hypothetical protein